jgi:hypothetical protein
LLALIRARSSIRCRGRGILESLGSSCKRCRLFLESRRCERFRLSSRAGGVPLTALPTEGEWDACLLTCLLHFFPASREGILLGCMDAWFFFCLRIWDILGRVDRAIVREGDLVSRPASILSGSSGGRSTGIGVVPRQGLRPRP